jgi:hypothetical protein
MKTTKTLSLFIGLVLILSSCDSIIEKTSKTVEGEAPVIEFTTTSSSAAPEAGLQAVKSAIDAENTLYEEDQELDYIYDKLEENDLSIKKLREFDITQVRLELPTPTIALLCTGLKFYIDNVLIAQQEGTISGTEITLALKSTDVLENIKSSDKKLTVKITSPSPLPANLLIRLFYKYSARIGIIA